MILQRYASLILPSGTAARGDYPNGFDIGAFAFGTSDRGCGLKRRFGFALLEHFDLESSSAHLALEFFPDHGRLH
jgi:hypothetical protein